MTPRSRARLRRALAFAALVAVVAALVLAPSRRPWILNVSPSMPIGLYELSPVDRPIQRGDIVSFCPSGDEAAVALARGYVGQGDCPARTAPILKLVAAVAGDAVTTTPTSEAVSAGGTGTPQCLSPGATLEIDSHGRPLPHAPFGRKLLGAGELWLWAPQPASYDSRYIGIATAGGVRGLVRPVWTTNSGAARLREERCA